MTDLPALPGDVGRPCPKAGKPGDCGQLHRGCSGHSRRNEGGPCGAQPMRGTDPPRCKNHLGRSPAVVRAEYLAKQQARILFEEARRTAARHGTAGLDVFAELLALGAEALTWKRACASLLGQVEELRYRAGSGEQLRAEVRLYTDAIERAAKILTDLAKLGIAERSLELRRQVSESQGLTVAAALTAALRSLGHDPDDLAVRQAVARELHRLSETEPQP